MKTNYVLRPCLGINQSSLFNASDDMAQHPSSRAEFLLNPDKFLSEFGVRITQPHFNNHQKTSEICTGPIFLCLAAVALAALVYNTVSIAMALAVFGSVMVEWSGVGMNGTITGNSYIGIV